ALGAYRRHLVEDAGHLGRGLRPLGGGEEEGGEPLPVVVRVGQVLQPLARLARAEVEGEGAAERIERTRNVAGAALRELGGAVQGADARGLAGGGPGERLVGGGELLPRRLEARPRRGGRGRRQRGRLGGRRPSTERLHIGHGQLDGLVAAQLG